MTLKEEGVLFLILLKTQIQMKTVGILVLCLLSFTGCRQTDVGRALGRPKLPPSCIANGDGTCFRDGERLPTTNMECTESSNVADFEDYLYDIELGYYKCRKNPSRCPRL